MAQITQAEIDAANEVADTAERNASAAVGNANRDLTIGTGRSADLARQKANALKARFDEQAKTAASQQTSTDVNNFRNQINAGLGIDASGAPIVGGASGPLSGLAGFAQRSPLLGPERTAKLGGEAGALGLSSNITSSGLTAGGSLGNNISGLNQNLLQSNISGLNNAAPGSSGTLQDLINQTQQQAGGQDPRFAAFRDAQLNQLRGQEERALGRESEFFGRRGLGGTSAALNQQAKTSQGFDERASTLGAQLDLQALQNQQGQQGQLGNLLASQFQQDLSGQQFKTGQEQAAFQQNLAGRQLQTSDEAVAFQQDLAGRQLQFGEQQAAANQQLAEQQGIFGQNQAAQQFRSQEDQNVFRQNLIAQQFAATQEERELEKASALTEIMQSRPVISTADELTKTGV